MRKVIITLNLETTATSLKLLRLLKLFIVWTKDNGHSPYGSFHRVVNANAKSATDVADRSITIDAGEEAKAIDNKGIVRGERFPCLCIAYNFTVAKLRKDLLQVVFANDVGSDDKLPVSF